MAFQGIQTRRECREGAAGWSSDWQGMPEINAIRQINMTEQTCYRWEEKYGGMGTDLRKELKRL